jgi:hypothetical protein
MIYPTPFPLEEAAERLFARALPLPAMDLLVIGRQFEIWGGPERLDLLALDGDAVPWIFEFKRNIVTEEAVSQLLSYGSYVAPLSRGQMIDMFARRHARSTLPEAFKERFGHPLPDQLSGTVKLVLAGFGFSDRCERVLDFLERGTGLGIGQLKVRFFERSNPRQNFFQIIKDPQASLPIARSLGGAPPNKYFVLAIEEPELCQTWEVCCERHLIRLRDNEVPVHNSPHRGSGLFVYARPHGLVAYGRITSRGKCVDAESPPAQGHHPKIAKGRPRHWEARVQWEKSVPWCDASAPQNFGLQKSGLFEIKSPEQLLEFRISFGVK